LNYCWHKKIEKRSERKINLGGDMVMPCDRGNQGSDQENLIYKFYITNDKLLTASYKI
jgi:hypothetical protein